MIETFEAGLLDLQPGMLFNSIELSLAYFSYRYQIFLPCLTTVSLSSPSP
jgi:hypothetical protein